jgi:predicted nucleotidyltransferase component of viral defense system
MIPRDFITEWRARAPWIQDAQVEQDLIISRALVEMFRRDDVRATFGFRGGTALYKLHVAPPARYSEDIDLVQIAPGPIGAALDAIRGGLDSWLGVPKRDTAEGGVKLIYRLSSEGPGSLPLRLKVEVNTREHFSVLGFEERRFEVQSRWFAGSAIVRTYPLDELLGTKLRALYQRRKGRDLFDLWFVGRAGAADPARVVDCFGRYMEHEGHAVSRAEFEANLFEKLREPSFVAGVAPLVAAGVEWDPAAAAAHVRHEFIGRLAGEPWKGPERSPTGAHAGETEAKKKGRMDPSPRPRPKPGTRRT